MAVPGAAGGYQRADQEGVCSLAGRRVRSGVVKASGGVCARLLRACPDNAAGRAPAPACTLSAPSLILSTAARGEAGGLQARFGYLKRCLVHS